MVFKLEVSENVRGFDDPEEEKRRFAEDVEDGLLEEQKHLPSERFYDDEGSILFQRIMELPEYYPTKCEAGILLKQKENLRSLLSHGDKGFNLIDLGAGDAQKTKVLLRHLRDKETDFTYMPVDISEGSMVELMGKLKHEFDDSLDVYGVAGEYEKALHWLIHNQPGECMNRPNLVLFLGGNIGNFQPRDARRFLRRLQMRLNNGDYLFTGFDLKKNRDVLEKAYNDSKGVTKEFNLNLLTRINRELGADFNIAGFSHHSYFNEERDAMESYLVNSSGIEQVVNIPYINMKFKIAPDESIRTEYSYKFEVGRKPPVSSRKQGGIEWLATTTGYEQIQLMFDSKSRFCDGLFRVLKSGNLES
ncbi:L-histidine N(alpha)-methyltransferase [Candidatus Pacearchaeota archaeon]|nr:L-histidine N(alpha)-methyltransferase [Candidatus Pacearchaeota archaeon]